MKRQEIFFCDEPMSVLPQGVTKHCIFINFFSISLGFSRFFRWCFKFLESKELNKTIISFALVGYETGYSQLSAVHLVNGSRINVNESDGVIGPMLC